MPELAVPAATSEGAAYRAEVRDALRELLSQAREEAGISLADAAALSGMRRQELRACENGNEGFSAAEALILAAAYGVSLDGLAETPDSPMIRKRERA